MKKIIYVAGIISVVTSLIFVLFGKLDVISFGTINTSVLGILYGWYQKLEKKSLEIDYILQEQELEASNKKVEYVRTFASKLNDELAITKRKLDVYTCDLPKLQEKLETDVEKELVVSKPKRTRKVKK